MTESPSEMARLGREIAAANPVRYSSEWIRSMRTHYRDVIADKEEFLSALYAAIYCQTVYGTSIIEYAAFDFAHRTHEERLNYVTWYNRYAYLAHLNNVRDAHLLDNKFEAYERLKKFYKREAMLLKDESDYPKFCEFVARHKSIFVKPVNLDLAEGAHRLEREKAKSKAEVEGEAGKGRGERPARPQSSHNENALGHDCGHEYPPGEYLPAEGRPEGAAMGGASFAKQSGYSGGRVTLPAGKVNDDGEGRALRQTFDALLEEARGIRSEKVLRPILHQLILEEEIVPSEKFAQFNRNEMSVLRVTTVAVDGQIHFFHPTFRIMCGDGDSHRGETYSIDAAVDAESGEVTTGGIDGLKGEFEFHPVSGVRIKGFKMPEWNALKAMLCEAAQAFPSLRHIGWDVVHTDCGWCIMEGNPSGEFFCQLCLGHGVRDEFENLIGFKFKTPPGFRWDGILKGLGERGERL